MASSSKMILEAAEQNFNMNNLKEAIFLANKAKQVDPDSDSANNLLAAYTVHLYASEGFRKNINWYKVLGIADTSADIETIKKNYKNLALKVHPDKNTSSAAEGAFKLIHQALDVLSQRCTRKDFGNLGASWSSLFRGEETKPPAPPPPTPPKNVKKSSKSKGGTSFCGNPPKNCPSCHGQCNTFWDEYWTSIMCTMCDWATHYPNDADYRYDYEYDQFQHFEDDYR